jgi:hypothetical protein
MTMRWLPGPHRKQVCVKSSLSSWRVPLLNELKLAETVRVQTGPTRARIIRMLVADETPTGASESGSGPVEEHEKIITTIHPSDHILTQ